MVVLSRDRLVDIGPAVATPHRQPDNDQRDAKGEETKVPPQRVRDVVADMMDRALFDQKRRTFSSGCVRVEDAGRLSRWLFGEAPEVSGQDQRVDLPSPVPVYIGYFTAGPGPEGLVSRADVYGRDPALLRRVGDRAGERPRRGPDPVAAAG